MKKKLAAVLAAMLMCVAFAVPTFACGTTPVNPQDTLFGQSYQIGKEAIDSADAAYATKTSLQDYVQKMVATINKATNDTIKLQDKTRSDLKNKVTSVVPVKTSHTYSKAPFSLHTTSSKASTSKKPNNQSTTQTSFSNRVVNLKYAMQGGK